MISLASRHLWLAKMVLEFDCSLVAVNNFEEVVEFFEVIVGGCWWFLLL